MYQHPIVLLIFSILLCFVSIKKCILKHKLLSNRIFFSFLLLFFMIASCLFYDEIKTDQQALEMLNYVYICLDVFVAVFLFFNIGNTMSNDSFYHKVVESLDEENIYLLIDKKQRIKKISSNFAAILEKDVKDCYNKKLSNIFDKAIAISAINGKVSNNKKFWQYYDEYQDNVDPDSKEQISLNVKNRNGEEFMLSIIETPVFSYNKFNGILWLGEKISEENLLGMEQTILQVNNELDALGARFTSLLECSKEAIFFVNLATKSIWCNDLMKEILDLRKNSITLQEYKNFISTGDLPFYESKVSNLSEENPEYNITYRYNVNGREVFIREHAKYCKTKQGIEIVGIIERIPDVHYEKTGIIELDNIKTEDTLILDVKKLHVEEQTYLLAVFNLDNIVEINEKYTRNFGNMVIAEYIRAIHKNFTDNNMIYRIGGLKFAAIITDLRKMDLMKNKLVNGESILHVKGSYGSVGFKLDVTMGLAYNNDAATAAGVYKHANEALKLAQNEKVSGNYVYYRDLR